MGVIFYGITSSLLSVVSQEGKLLSQKWLLGMVCFMLDMTSLAAPPFFMLSPLAIYMVCSVCPTCFGFMLVLAFHCHLAHMGSSLSARVDFLYGFLVPPSFYVERSALNVAPPVEISNF